MGPGKPALDILFRAFARLYPPLLATTAWAGQSVDPGQPG